MAQVVPKIGNFKEFFALHFQRATIVKKIQICNHNHIVVSNQMDINIPIWHYLWLGARTPLLENPLSPLLLYKKVEPYLVK